MSTGLLSITGTGFQIATSKEADILKKELLATSSKVVEVKNNTQVALARFSRDRIHDTLKQVEEMRVEINKPILAAQREVNAKAKEFGEDLLKEKARIESLMGTYARELEAKRREAEAEALRLRQEQQRLLDEAEAKRQKALDDLEAAATKKQRQKAMAEIERTEVAVETVTQSTEAKAGGLMAVAGSSAPKGVKDDIDFEVTDIRALLKHDQFLCEVTPRRQEILRRLRLQAKDGETVGFPGLRVFQTTKVR